MEGFLGQSIPKPSSFTPKLIFSLALVGALGLICTLSLSSSSAPVSESSLAEHEFKRFLTSFNKFYSPEEFSYRFNIFKENSAKIRLFNSWNDDVVLAVNKFADLTHEEFKSMYTSQHPPVTVMDSPWIEVGAPPTSWDWRDKGAVTDVGNQLNCTGGWAFAATGAVEGSWFIGGNLLEDLSVQEILDCTSASTSNGCKGGLVQDALAFVKASNITTDLAYPFISYDLPCSSSSVKNYAGFIYSFNQVNPLNSPSALLIAISMTPVAAAVEADEYVWQFYNSGVVGKYCGTNTNHNVLLVGYNYTAGYYTAKNSWGQDWGESGYIRLGTGGGSKGVCGVATNTFYTNSTKP